ncbi:archaeosortase/exosortase family protein [Aridibaculum aurantiacum]|uniref:archaeosortase/exosortase family protein n=1 Tax=Aridibaculum aurantiacum TaxID=2810307 RepID=UPI001A95891B|nr:archaeosortase/exosortase family protein [Aridibaculum aurantiacum]
MWRSIWLNSGYRFIIKLLGIFCVLYFGHIFYWSASDPKGLIFIPIIESEGQPFYMEFLRSTILHSANNVLHLLDHNASIYGHVLVLGEKGVRLNSSCIGIGLFSFWIAFVVAHEKNFKTTITWILLGVLIFWIVNVIRIATLLMSLIKGWKPVFNIEHHDLYNFFVYLVVLLLAIFFNKRAGQLQRPGAHS